MYRAIIIDDELNAVKGLKLMIEKYSSAIKVVAVSTDPEEGIRLIENYRPEIVFLDVSMPGMDGFELLGKLRHKDFKLVFTTAHENYALRAIKNKAQDYIMKPIDIDDLKACLSNLVNPSGKQPFSEQSKPLVLEVAVRDGIIFIKPEDIIRLEASGSYTVFHLAGNLKHMASKTLKEYEMFLDPDLFYRCHNSHLINLAKVVKFVNKDGYFAQMSDQSFVEISRRKKDDFINRLKSAL